MGRTISTFDGWKTSTTPIGLIRVTKPAVVKRADFECAAWWAKYNLEPGEYPMVASWYPGGLSRVVSHIKATVLSDNFQSLWCGSPIGKPYNTKQFAGNVRHYTWDTYLYEILDVSYSGPEWAEVTLDADIDVVLAKHRLIVPIEGRAEPLQLL